MNTNYDFTIARGPNRVRVYTSRTEGFVSIEGATLDDEPVDLLPHEAHEAIQLTLEAAERDIRELEDMRLAP